jgi:hypothetical protein
VISDPRLTRVMLTREERLLLTSRFPLSADLRAQFERESNHAMEAWITHEEADALRERAADLLQAEGFDEEYEPTPLGRLLETLIDKLFTG